MELREPILSETLSADQYKNIMEEISLNHRFGGTSKKGLKSRHIKYVRPNWDMRDGMCFSISFDNVTFDFRGSAKSMYIRVMDWLNGAEADTGEQ